MAAHRYWRARRFRTYEGGATFALSEFQLLAGTTRVDAGATLTADQGPISGTIAALMDGTTSSTVVLPIEAVLTWDFASTPQDVTDIRLGSGVAQATFPLYILVEWSDDAAAWTALYDDAFPGIKWPGAQLLTVTAPRVFDGALLQSKAWTDGVTADGTIYTSAGTSTYALDSGSRLALGVSGTDIKVRFTSVPSTADVDVTVQVLAGSAEAGIVLRTSGWVNANDTYAYGVFVNSSNVIVAKAGNGGAASYTALATVPHGYSTSSTLTLRVRWEGIRYSVWVNGDLKIAGTDSTYTAAGQVGLRVYSGVAYFYTLSVRQLESRDSLALNAVRGITQPQRAARVESGAGVPPSLVVLPVPTRRARPNYLFAAAARGRISGTVKRKDDPTNMPVRRRVRLTRDRDGLLVAETWSDAATGAYEFVWIEEWEAYTVLAYDYEHNYRAVVADNLTPEVIA